MRATFVFTSCAAAMAFAAAVAVAKEPAPAAAATPTPAFDKLPEAHVSTVPKSIPVHIGAGEKAPGFVASLPPLEERQRFTRVGRKVSHVYLFESEATAKKFVADKLEEDDASDVCFTDGEDAPAPEDESAAIPWPTQAQPRPALSFELPGPQNPKARGIVHAMHAEKLVVGTGGHATLETADAFVDATTLGSRPIGHATLQLALLGTGPNGMEVYGARDGESLQVVVKAGKAAIDNPIAARDANRMGRSLQVVLPGEGSGSSECGHLRFSLSAGRGEAEMATVQATALLPPVDKADLAPPKDVEVDTDEMKAMRLLQAMRMRAVHVNVSATQISTEKTPVISVAFGWGGPEVKRGM